MTRPGVPRVRTLATVVAFVLLAGCSDAPPADPPQVEGPGVITDPTMGLDQTGAHIHDYWGGEERLVIIGDDAPADESGLGPGFATAGEVPVREFRPSSGHVVPQGTASVEVTFSWTDAEDGLDQYSQPTAYVKTAGTNATERLGETENGGTLVLETGLPAADLPHQLLSAWAFELRMSAAPDTGVLRFKGVVSLHVEAVRGLELPVFPPHPDHWNGSAEIRLVDAEGTLAYWEDTGDGGSNGNSGPVVFTPTSGAIVPVNASHVAVVVAYTGQFPLELWYHSATSRELAVAEPTASEPGQVTFELPVADGGDGPYATQSQWEFTVKPVANGPLRTAWFTQYTITATAIKA
jgi:hypothetical protein